ncbi:MAG: hypothetical protein M3Q70_03790, partial [bacterium]|nr:hypothetical protein [bacterium]
MGRPIILSNSRLAVGLNEGGFVHDFYFPYVGLENLTTSRRMHHKIGVWVDGQFSWLDGGKWSIDIRSSCDSLNSDITMTNEELGLKIHFTDWVDVEKDVFCRDLNVKNLWDVERDFRIFFHQVFQISNDGRSDTVLFVPDEHYMLDYKGRVCLLAYARTSEG